MLQNRINELYSGIIDLKENETHVTGFYNAESLKLHLKKNISNFSSKGIYSNEKIHFKDIQTNALFIVKRNSKVIEKYQFKLIYKKVSQPIDRTNKIILNIRENIFTNEYNVKTESTSDMFENFEKLKVFLLKNYRNAIQIIDQIEEE